MSPRTEPRHASGPRKPGQAGRLAAWAGRLRAAFRLVTSGRRELASQPHEPLIEPAWPGSCTCGRLLDHPLHGKARRLRVLRGGLPAQRRRR